MQAGKILSTVRQIATTTVSSLGAGKRDRDSGGNQYQSNQKEEREATEEEAEAAAKILNEDEAWIKSGLKASFLNIEGKNVVEVSDSFGRKLKTLRRSEILIVLSKTKPATAEKNLGRILDRSF